MLYHQPQSCAKEWNEKSGAGTKAKFSFGSSCNCGSSRNHLLQTGVTSKAKVNVKPVILKLIFEATVCAIINSLKLANCKQIQNIFVQNVVKRDLLLLGCPIEALPGIPVWDTDAAQPA